MTHSPTSEEAGRMSEVTIEINGTSRRLAIGPRVSVLDLKGCLALAVGAAVTTVEGERQPVPVRCVREHRQGDLLGGGAMRAFSYTRAQDAPDAVARSGPAPPTSAAEPTWST